MIVPATFKGQDGILGYKLGKSYTFRFYTQNQGNQLYYQHIIIDPFYNRECSPCPYRTLKSFMDNWDIV